MESIATPEEIRRFLSVPGYGYGYGSGYGSGYGYGYGSGSGDGYGSGSGYGYGSGDGYGDGDGVGDGYGSGYGYGYGSGSGYGYGYGDGDGDGDGDGVGDGYGSGYGYGYGSGYGDGDGVGDGYGSGSGYGYGSGSGDGDDDGVGYGDGYGDILKFEGDEVHYIDDIPCIIMQVHGDIAVVAVIGSDLTLTSAYVAKVGNSFAHGETPREALQAAMDKDMEERPLEERIDAFVEAHPDLDTPYGDLFQWHHTLTGSCEFGRKEWCKAHGYQPTDSITVRTFIEGTRNDYGGDAICELAERYGIK